MGTAALQSRVPGWNAFAYSLVGKVGGRMTLVSDDIVRAYVDYVTRCRARSARALSFDDWLTKSDDVALGASTMIPS